MPEDNKPRFVFSDKTKEIAWFDDETEIEPTDRAEAPQPKKSHYEPDPSLRGLLHYFDQFGFGDISKFLQRLEKETRTLEKDRNGDNGKPELDPVKICHTDLKPVRDEELCGNGHLDTGEIYSAYINKDDQGTHQMQAVGEMDWIKRFYAEVGKILPTPTLINGWFWGGEYPQCPRTHKGRFFLSVYHPYAVNFWEEMFEIKQELRSFGINIRYKLTCKFEDFERGDCAVVHFDAASQTRVLDMLAQMVSRNKRWFKENIPLFAAQMLDRSSQPIKGLSFGQNLEKSGTSFGYERSQALSQAARVIRREINEGETVDVHSALEIIADNLTWRKVDINYPAFNLGGIKVFSEIFKFTDQYHRLAA